MAAHWPRFLGIRSQNRPKKIINVKESDIKY